MTRFIVLQGECMPGKQDKDRELVKRAQRGDQHAFGDLYVNHAPAIFRYLFAHLENSMDAEDLTGEVFLKAWQSLPKYIERGVPFLAFLFRIARNALVDHYRQNNRLEHKAPEDMDGYKMESVPEPVETVGRRLEHQKILGVLSQLRPDYQSVLTLRFISELSPEETAQVMNRSVGAIRVLQHRALAALRSEIGKTD
jgi:RNA polymerase sigma-70 factor (ECF subfamily)